MIFNQLTSYVEDVLKSYILNEILLVATSINFYSLWVKPNTSKELHCTWSKDMLLCIAAAMDRDRCIMRSSDVRSMRLRTFSELRIPGATNFVKKEISA